MEQTSAHIQHFYKMDGSLDILITLNASFNKTYSFEKVIYVTNELDLTQPLIIEPKIIQNVVEIRLNYSFCKFGVSSF